MCYFLCAVDGAAAGIGRRFGKRFVDKRGWTKILFQNASVIGWNDVGVDEELAVVVGVRQDIVRGMPRHGENGGANVVVRLDGPLSLDIPQDELAVMPAGRQKPTVG